MTSSLTDVVLGFLRDTLGTVAHIEWSGTLIGQDDFAGVWLPRESSVAKIETSTRAYAYFPIPKDPGMGPARVVLHGGNHFVFPVVRLRIPNGKSISSTEFITPEEMLDDAFRRWKYQTVGTGKKQETGPGFTMVELFRRANLEENDQILLAAAVYHQTFWGRTRQVGHLVQKKLGCLVPARKPLARFIGKTDLSLVCAERLVLTCSLRDGSDKTNKKPTCLHPDICPDNSVKDRFHFGPESPDLGIDPVHTPEGSEIRLTGRLGMGVEIKERRLVSPSGVPLSPSTSQVPFAGHNDPRRLLMAANAQVQAVNVSGSEKPFVRAAGSRDLPCPPGVNLRVAYMAWRGLNHEDGWVLSESATKLLSTTEETDLYIQVGSLELDPEILFKTGDIIRAGQPLVSRKYSPLLVYGDVASLRTLNPIQLGGAIPPGADIDVKAPWDGELAGVEVWDHITGNGIPPGLIHGRCTKSFYRKTVRFRLRRTLPLEVGDKLANRHGHKGVVGAILPDSEMPLWNGEPLHALIDPISVLNRSNWGQILETHLAANGVVLKEVGLIHDGPTPADGGTSLILPPLEGAWMRKPVRCLAGRQFVMRMPQHARSKVSASPVHRSDRRSLRKRAQRFGEMDHYAWWAHQKGSPGNGDRSPMDEANVEFQHLLSASGFEMSQSGKGLIARPIDLSGQPPKGWKSIQVTKQGKPSKATRAKDGKKGTHLPPANMLADAIDNVTTKNRTAIVLPKEVTSNGRRVEWVPVVPFALRKAPPWLENHELTVMLRKIASLSLSVARGGSKEDSCLKKLANVIHRYQKECRKLAIGARHGWPDTEKISFLRLKLLGGTSEPSVRAVASPAGPAGLGLDEVGVPPALARSLIGPDSPEDRPGLDSALSGKTFFLKRDPVLHRWGLLRVKCRLLDGNTIRLPASLLGPMGADFDGDTVALFAGNPAPGDPDAVVLPQCLPLDDSNTKPQFVPGKQYRYGLKLLGDSPAALEELQEELLASGAPPWPAEGGGDPGKSWEKWTAQLDPSHARGEWWAIIEKHALAALASDPGMGLRVPANWKELAELPCVQCGAAKRDVFSDKARKLLEGVLAGQSLAPLKPGGESGSDADIIDKVMVSAKMSVGKFGGALRRLIYRLPSAEPPLVRDAQTLTEIATQKALSVKAGSGPLEYKKFRKILDRIIDKKNKYPLPNEGDFESLLECFELDPEQSGSLALTCLRLATAARQGKAPEWAEWLRAPSRLEQILSGLGDAGLEIPRGDWRSVALFKGG